jgi:peptidoglycan L-alanyl-D-glutamate endopeptidase CwlK
VSAGTASASAATVDRNLDALAPKFAAAVREALARCTADGLHAIVYEANRSAELQALYYERGRSVVPPSYTVTNARSNLFSWHGYGLAVDVIHEAKGWDAAASWFAQVADHFRAAGCRWGGEWKFKDLPHFQWALCRPSPSDRARELLAAGGRAAVWQAVGAD